MTRERMSRPNSSAPSQYCAPGLWRLSMSRCWIGSRGANQGAPIAVIASSATMTRPTRASRLRNSRLRASPRKLAATVRSGSDAASATVAMRAVDRLSLARDAGIEGAVREIHDQVHEDERHGKEQHRALQQDVVAREDRLDHEPAKPRPCEDRLGQHGAAHELPRLEAEQRQDRDQRVAERVLRDH